MYKLIVLDRNTRKYKIGQIICIKNNYMKLELFTNDYCHYLLETI